MSRQKSKPINAWQEIDAWAVLMADAPEDRRPDDLDLVQIAERRHVEQAQAGRWAEEQVKLGKLKKHKVKDESTKRVKWCYHPVHNSADPLMTTGLPERGRHKRAG